MKMMVIMITMIIIIVIKIDIIIMITRKRRRKRIIINEYEKKDIWLKDMKTFGKKNSNNNNVKIKEMGIKTPTTGH